MRLTQTTHYKQLILDLTDVTLCRVKARSDEKPGSSDWQDWDDDWDDQGASLARRGNSVKQKRPQKWDDDW